MSDDGRIDVRRDGKIGVLTINRPHQLNSLTSTMVGDLRDLAAELDADPEVAVIVLRADGDRAFCVGGDLFELLPKAATAGRDVLNPDPAARFFSAVYTPIVAGIRGLCLGGGFEMILGADIRVVAEDASFGLPEVKHGLIPGSGTPVRLPRQLPWAPAMELLLEGGRIDAERAYQLGLVNAVVPADQLDDAVFARARRISRHGPLAVRTAKEIAVRSLALESAFELEFALNSRVLRSDDAAAGIAAFSTRSEAEFRGR